MTSSQQSRDVPERPVSSYAEPSGSVPPTDAGPSTHDPSTATSSSDTTVHSGFTHPRHPNCPDSLNCLVDTNDKPNHILPIIIRSAIMGSPMRKLTLRGIYAVIEEKWPYYRTAPPGWKDSIRHNLSLNRLFKKLPRPRTESGHGSYWTVDLYAPPGSKRPRKRRAPGQAIQTSSPNRKSYATSGDVGAVIMPPFRLADATEEDDSNANADPSMAATAASHKSHSESELDEGGLEYIPSDCESEDAAAVASPPPGAGSKGLGATVLQTKQGSGSSESHIDRVSRLEEQLLESQRQLSMASALSLRLAQQLEETQEEASRAQVKLQDVREQLEEEQVARTDVEKRLEIEERLRKEAEGRLKTMIRGDGGYSRLSEAIRSIQDISRKALDLDS